MSKQSQSEATSIVDEWYNQNIQYAVGTSEWVSSLNQEILKTLIADALDRAWQEGFNAAEFNLKFQPLINDIRKSDG
jgi:hypothetical protein